MKINADLDEYRCPDEIYQLLCTWGRIYMIGSPHLNYPRKAAVVGEYIPPRVKDSDEPPKLDMADFDRLCLIIDTCLNFPKQEALKCKFMYRMPDKSKWSRRHSAAYMGLTVPEYLTLLRSAMRKVDLLMQGEIAA